MKTLRKVIQVIEGIPASDGAGVKLTRIIGSPRLDMLDPFLLLDAFASEDAQDYIAGFPPHPHRGFETVTYMLAGKMRHKDSAGNEGVIEAGGVQWMTAGRGIIHSEMPEQEQGLLSGFQLWVNLPADHKMDAPNYQEKSSSQIAIDSTREGIDIRVIAGTTQAGIKGVIHNTFVAPIYWDVHQQAGTRLAEAIPAAHNGFIYVYRGNVTVENDSQSIQAGQLAVLSAGDSVQIRANQESRYLLIAGKPLNEPVARGGPFVMNTREEINQAFADYQSGSFA